MPRYTGCIVAQLLKQKTFTGRPKTREERNQVTFDEAERMLPQMKGLRVCFNHDESVKIGHVVNARITPNGSFDIDFEVDLRDNVIQELVDTKVFKGLSLSHEFNSCRPVEVSICWEGARPGTEFKANESNECNRPEYIVDNSDEMIIRASVTHANRFVEMNPAQATMNALSSIAHPLQPPPAAQPQQPLQQQQPLQTQPQTAAPEVQANAEDQAAGEAIAAIGKDENASTQDLAKQLLQSAAIQRLFMSKNMSNEDKDEVKNHFIHLIEKHTSHAAEIDRLKLAVTEAEKQMDDYKKMTKHTNQAVFEAFKELGQEIDEAKAAKLQKALENPMVRESGIGEMIVQCSRFKQTQEQVLKQMQEKAMSPAEQRDRAMYSTFCTLLDGKSMSPQEPLVQASKYKSVKRPYEEVNTHRPSIVTNTASLTGDSLLDSLLRNAPSSTNFKRQSTDTSSKERRL